MPQVISSIPISATGISLCIKVYIILAIPFPDKRQFYGRFILVFFIIITNQKKATPIQTKTDKPGIEGCPGSGLTG
jgi:hypothetical protein